MNNIKIRKATLEDIERMVELGAEMHLESSYRCYDFNPTKTANTLVSVIEDRRGIAIVAEKDGIIVGGFLGNVSSHYFGNDLVASDMALFVTKEERRGRLAIRLLTEFMDIADSLGAKHISIGTTTGVNADRVKALYEHFGLKHVGYHFHKGVS